MKNAPQFDLSDFKPSWVIIFMIVQLGTTLVLLLSRLVQTEVITEEIYSLLFQRVLLFVLELIRLLFL